MGDTVGGHNDVQFRLRQQQEPTRSWAKLDSEFWLMPAAAAQFTQVSSRAPAYSVDSSRGNFRSNWNAGQRRNIGRSRDGAGPTRGVRNSPGYCFGFKREQCNRHPCQCMYTVMKITLYLAGVVKTHLSDHFLTFTIINCYDVKEPPNTIRFRSFRDFKEDAFVNDLIQLPFVDILSESDVDEAWNEWYDLLMSVINMFVPYKTKRIREKQCLWINGDIIVPVYTRDFYHRKAMRFDLPQFWEEYRKKRDEVISSIRTVKHEYVNGLLNEKAGCLSVLWVTIKHRSSNVKDSSIKLNIDGKDVVEPEMVAESLNNYSIDSVSLIHCIRE